MIRIENIWRFLGGRKFVALILATVLLLLHAINQSAWLTIVLTWLGVEGIADIVSRSKGQ